MIETTYMRLEAAAKALKISTDTLLTAALEDRVRIWGLLFEWRDYWTFDFSAGGEHDGLPDKEGSAYFAFVPLHGRHVAALVKNGKVTTDLLSDENGVRKLCAGDSEKLITITRREPLYVLASDVQRIQSEGRFPASVPKDPDFEIKARAEHTYLNIVGGLLGLMLGKSPSTGKSYSVYESQGAIIDALIAHYAGKPGLSRRTLETKFAQAKFHIT